MQLLIFSKELALQFRNSVALSKVFLNLSASLGSGNQLETLQDQTSLKILPLIPLGYSEASKNTTRIVSCTLLLLAENGNDGECENYTINQNFSSPQKKVCFSSVSG